MTEKRLNAGEVIFHEGDSADAAYVVLSGSVEIFYSRNGAETSIGIIEAGRAFGEGAVLAQGILRPYTARAVTETLLQMMAIEEFQSLLGACPDAIKPFLLLAFERIAPTKTFVKPSPSAVAKGDIGHITISPASEGLNAQFKPMEITVSALPFRIGGYPQDGEKNRKDQLNLAISSQKSPMIVSRQHCEITLDGQENIIVHDLGSRFCTIVNGIAIGRGRGFYTAALQKGENELYLGGIEYQYKLTVVCS